MYTFNLSLYFHGSPQTVTNDKKNYCRAAEKMSIKWLSPELMCRRPIEFSAQPQYCALLVNKCACWVGRNCCTHTRLGRPGGRGGSLISCVKCHFYLPYKGKSAITAPLCFPFQVLISYISSLYSFQLHGFLQLYV